MDIFAKENKENKTTTLVDHEEYTFTIKTM